MRFDQPFIKLPLQFDAGTLEREVRDLPESAWVPHPTGFPGNEAVRLVTVGGQPTDGFEGPMRPTENLARLPYVQQIMAKLDGVWSRSRLMGLGAGADVPEHVDAHYHWRTHVRIHVPVITDPKVLFTCGDQTVHMAAGQCWLFDSFRWHRVENGWTERRVHLVLDTVMTPSVRKLIDSAQSGATDEFVKSGPPPRELRFEQFNVPSVISPWEIRCHVDFIFSNAVEHERLSALRERLDHFADDWASVWAQFAASPQGVAAYRRLIAECRADVANLAGSELALTNTVLIRDALDQMVFGPAISPNLGSGNIVAQVPRQRLAS
ncbi:MAG TPA: aspartyl/asparaginyl beta-hydroxylase domain-containing protein [Sphingomicrobium sp.]